MEEESKLQEGHTKMKVTKLLNNVSRTMPAILLFLTHMAMVSAAITVPDLLQSLLMVFKLGVEVEVLSVTVNLLTCATFLITDESTL